MDFTQNVSKMTIFYTISDPISDPYLRVPGGTFPRSPVSMGILTVLKMGAKIVHSGVSKTGHFWHFSQKSLLKPHRDGQKMTDFSHFLLIFSDFWQKW